MKKIVLTALAATMFVAPAISAQAAPMVPSIKVKSDVETVQYRPGDRHDNRRYDDRRHGWDKRAPQYKRNHWKRGQRMYDWRRYERVDYRRHKLRTPPRGYQWVRDGNDYLMISVASGLIASIIAGR